jgi:hypothetical protein
MTATVKERKEHYATFITHLIENFPVGTPIFNEEVTTVVVNEFHMDLDRARKLVNTNMNRLNGELVENYSKGIYYKPRVTAFGKSPLNPTQLIVKKYIKSNDTVYGYETGASLLQQLGLTTQIPKYQYIATNVAQHVGNKIDRNLKVVLRKPKLKVTPDNFKYLQFLDALENKDHTIIDAAKPFQTLNNFIEKNHLDFRKLASIAKSHYSVEVCFRILDLAGVT